ncbi:MAG: sugar ABC transporter substrate-binding protein [Rubrobacteraceae bacterium]|jgi:ribose transport system substrate-binding protein
MNKTRALRVVTLAVLILAVLLLLTACRGALAPESQQKKAQGTTVGFVPKALNQEFWITSRAGATDADKQMSDVEVIVDAGSSELAIDEQIAVVEDMLTKQVDALAVAPTAPDQLKPVLQRASEQIPVLIVDSDIPSWDGKITYIGTDNVEGGRVAGEYIIDQMKGSGTLALINGVPGATSGEDRIAGVKDAVKGTDIEVVAEVAADFDRAEGVSAMEDILQNNPDVNAVFAANDQMALGALEALKSRGKTEDILLVGYDGTEEATEVILKDQGIVATVAQDPYEMGKVGVEEAVAAAKDQSVKKTINTGVTLVTAENAESYLKEYRERLSKGS